MFLHKRIGLSIAALLATSVALGACAPDPGPGDETGTARAAINNVPSDGSVACIAVTATGSWATTQSFDVLPGQSTVFTLTGIPIGTVRFDGAAFATSCAQVTPMSTPTWVSTPVLASVVIGQTTALTLSLHQAGNAGVGVGFTPEPACRSTGLPCLVNAECCSAVCGANSTCLPPASMCAPAGGACAQPSDCCNGQCANGVCQTGCLVPSDCPGVDTECGVRACTAGACGLVLTPAGAPVSAQAIGDCRVNACDGAGNVVNLVDDSDVPNDSNQCTIDLCSGGVPALVPAPAGTACSQNGGSACDGGGSCVPPATVCGDGIITPPELCDDGNAVSGDGCSSNCTVEVGYVCFNVPSTCQGLCGDGILAGAEACDDGNNVNGDGCAAFCAVEAGFVCSGAPSVCSSFVVCGDGILSPGEACDDGNLTNGDGCSATCSVEAGYTCVGMPSACSLLPVCGDGILANNESCDDGNAVSGDGCSSSCTIEVGYTCFNVPSACVAICGDGILAGAEACDDGNNVNGDGCAAFCAVEAGFVCSGAPSVCSSFVACGDGIVSPGEACDDGNTAGNDGCSAKCQVESPYTCAGSPSVCTSPVEINCNDGVDNDGNGLVDCADPACALHCSASVGACGAGETALVLAAAALPAPIPDNNATGVSRFLNVGGLGVITRVVIQLDITHTFDADLDVKLFSPNNVSTDVTSDNGASGDNYAATIFNSACATLVTAGAAPFSGCFRPEASFAGYSGAPASGQWRLTVSDDAAGDTGTLNAFRLALCVAPSLCGDGQIDPGEACDDGNTTSGDGCSSICQTEP